MLSFRHILAGGAAATLAFATVSAQDMAANEPNAAVDISTISGGTYSVDSAHSMVGWRVLHFGFNDYLGIFGDVSGTLRLDTENPDQSSVSVTIPIAAVTVPSSELRDHLLRPGADGGEPDFFGPNPEPATFESTSVDVAADRRSAMIEGNLTMNGVTRPVTLNARLTGAGTNPMNQAETVGFEAETSIDRSEFGIDYGMQAIGDTVDLNITIAFEKDG
ncbi:hypothetical protein GRI38_03995 [Altererythrobacter aurantiacus]|uniref:Lipid/polyisoprenoid-binding YceI-like domain-containing protein n=1 Tax=Parapontixanthobacter aurantiacus TaxID=1463599 RepID=A0A844ZCC0_9SPHN|nr:YceI family protein [Parapontixanthobacter aurantiacus]MXO85184.1 hypothetical protein [Parapontixanthobacter aurantiacus]